MRRIITVVLACIAPSTTFADQANMVLSKTEYASGEKIVLSFSGFSGKAQDWITIVAKGKPDDTYGEYFYTDGKEEGTLTFAGLQPGEYEVRGYFDWPAGGYSVVARVAFSVRRDATTEPASAPPPAPTTGPQEAKAASLPEGVILFTRKSGNTTDLFSVKPDGSGLSQLTRFGDWEECAKPEVSPDSGKVLFLHGKKMGHGLSLLDLRTKGVTNLVDPDGKEEVLAAVWSPDGGSILCLVGDGFDNQLCVMDAKGNRKQRSSIEGYKEPPISLSSDGVKILFTLSPPEKEGDGTSYMNKDVCLRSLSPSSETNLTSDPGNSEAARISPDGQSIVYVHADIQSTEGQVKVMAYPAMWRMSADGKDQKRLTDGKAWDYQPAWSPDGKTIAFISSRSAGYDNLFVMNADGSGVRQLSEQDYTKKMGPKWSQDGRFIYYLSEESFTRKLHAVSVETGENLKLVDDCFDFAVGGGE